MTPPLLWHLVRSLAAPLGLLSVLAGCEAITGPRGDEGELKRRQQQWEVEGPADYDFVMRHECFCVLGGVPIRVEVRRDTVRLQAIAETGQEIPPSQWPLRRTVDDLFEVLQDAFDRDAAEIDASYDLTLGYPRSARIDYEKYAVDEEYGWTILSLTPR